MESTVLSDRFAAVNMSAGHPGGVRFHNLAELPICLQVGEEDGDEREFIENGKLRAASEYERNQKTVESAKALQTLGNNNTDAYTYDIFIHPTKAKTTEWAHNSWSADEHADRNDTLVIKNWANFRTDRSFVPRNTCAVRWVSNATRNPFPPLVIWDISPAPEDQPIIPSEWGNYRFFYWLAVEKSSTTATTLQNPTDATDPINTIKARYNGHEQWVWIEQSPASVAVTILLNSGMGFDLSKPIMVYYSISSPRALIATLPLEQYDSVQEATLRARGDPNYIFSATIVVDPAKREAKDGGGQIFSTGPRAML